MHLYPHRQLPYTRATMLPRLILRSSPVHGCGCYTLDSIRSGARVAEYDGPRMTKAEADERYADRDITYLFGVQDRDTVIDGFGTAMFINHCCEPNCQTEEDEEGHVYILALRNIAAGEELTYEYHLYDSDEDDQPCYCSTDACRGTMFSEAEVRRRKKLGLPMTLKKPARRK
ncbi:SET domain-containing protein [Terriglobus sp. TAA 43]|uniref:SET domain-containing protein n=1 Tax=Terriglobus sp. TAA 43 TaxID=278961 RepID=UPI003510CAF0